MSLPVRARDSRNRRIRYAKPQPIGEWVRISAADEHLFEAIHRHGPLPSCYLRYYVSHGNENAFTDRLTKLYNGAAKNGPFLVKPPKQHDSIFADIQHLAYDLHPNAEKLLKEQGKWSRFARRDNHFVHTLFTSCLGASLELALREKYITRDTILSKAGTSLELQLSRYADQRHLVPDDLFGISYGDGYRFFSVEVDRATESGSRTETEGKSPPTLEKKFKAYLEVIENRSYRQAWGVPSLMVLFATTTDRQMKMAMRTVTQLTPKYASRFLFKVFPVFGSPWRVPTDVLDLSGWVDGNGQPFDLMKKDPH